MKICVIGVGGVGGYFGGRLAAAGNTVMFIARGDTLDVLQRTGLRVDSPLGNIGLSKVEVSEKPHEVGEVDAVVLGVKAWQVPEVAKSLSPLIGDKTVVLPLQNGVEAASQLVEELGEDHVLGGMCRIVSFVVEPGHIRHQGVEPFVAFGELDNHQSERVERLAEVFSNSGIDTKIAPDILSSIWQKLLFIAPVSGLGAVTRVPVGEMRSNAEVYAMLREAMEEVRAVAVGRGVALADDAVEKTVAFFDGLPDAMTSSMQRDIMDGKPSELDALNGAVVRFANEIGVATPVHRFIYAVLAPSEARARKTG